MSCGLRILYPVYWSHVIFEKSSVPFQARLSNLHNLIRWHRFEVQGLAIPLGTIAALDQIEETGVCGGSARGAGGVWSLISCNFAQTCHLSQFSFSSALAWSRDAVMPAGRITLGPACCSPFMAQSHCDVGLLAASRL